MFFGIFTLLSAIAFGIGMLSLVSPRWTLIFLPEERRDEVNVGRAYTVIMRVGGAMMAFICAPLILVAAFAVLLFD